MKGCEMGRFRGVISLLMFVFAFETTHGKPNVKRSQGHNGDYDVLILGAGIAGVAAASTLSEVGIDNYLILEGTHRVGGRMKEVKLGQTTVELGASWIHGTTGSPNNPIYDLAKVSKLKYKANNYDDWLVVDENGKDVTRQANQKFEEFYKAFENALDHREDLLDHGCTSDYSFTNVLAMEGWTAKDPVDEICELFEIDFLTSMPADVSSLKYFFGRNKDYPYVDEEFYVLQESGYSTVVRDLLKSISDWDSKIKFNTTVKEIMYTNEKVVVKTSQGQYTGKYALVTFSLGVLQHRAVTFQPPLPEQKTEAIFGFNMGIYYNIYLKFPSTGQWFVPNNTEWTLYASSRRGYYPIWQNFEKHIPGSRIMHCTVLHEEAKRIDRLSDEEVKTEAVEVLRILFGHNVPDAEDIAFSRWLSDPFTYGSFADWPKGFNEDSFETLKAPVGRLHFAGDAYHDDFGYSQGAYLSSVRESMDIAKKLAHNQHCCS